MVTDMSANKTTIPVTDYKIGGDGIRCCRNGLVTINSLVIDHNLIITLQSNEQYFKIDCKYGPMQETKFGAYYGSAEYGGISSLNDKLIDVIDESFVLVLGAFFNRDCDAPTIEEIHVCINVLARELCGIYERVSKSLHIETLCDMVAV